MTLDQAIQHCLEKAKELRAEAEKTKRFKKFTSDCLECASEHQQLAEWLTELQERREADRWIPVSERLPDDMQKVLIWFEYYRYGDFNCMYQTYGFGYVCDGKWSPFINGETGWQDYNIIAWKPLPEPYKENDK